MHQTAVWMNKFSGDHPYSHLFLRAKYVDIVYIARGNRALLLTPLGDTLYWPKYFGVRKIIENQCFDKKLMEKGF